MPQNTPNSNLSGQKCLLINGYTMINMDLGMSEILSELILPLLIYSGPLFTYGLVAKLYPTKPRSKIFKISLIVHLLTFLPFIVLFILRVEDALYALILPAFTGV